MDDERINKIKICFKNEPKKVVCLLKDIPKNTSVKEIRELQYLTDFSHSSMGILKGDKSLIIHK